MSHTDDDRRAALLQLLRFAQQAMAHIRTLAPELGTRLERLEGRDIEHMADDLMARYDAATLNDVLFPEEDDNPFPWDPTPRAEKIADMLRNRGQR